MTKPMHQPIAFIVGAQRSGTTYLSQVLDQHPEICMAKPLIPEPKFFMKDSICSSDEYISKFYRPTASTKILIEKSASYIETPEAAQRIKRMFPNARILITLRNPVFRAISNYFYSVRNGLETRTIDDAIRGTSPAPTVQQETSVDPFSYLRRGHYAPYVKSYFDVFGRKNCNVIIFTRLVGQSEPIRELFDWLNVDATFTPPKITAKVNSNDVVYDVPAELVSFMEKHFAGLNTELEDLLQTEIPEWRVSTSSAPELLQQAARS